MKKFLNEKKGGSYAKGRATWKIKIIKKKMVNYSAISKNKRND